MCAKDGRAGDDTLDKMKVKLDKAADFGEWYNQLVELAELTDKRYPAKGMNVWRPYGWKLMQAIDRNIRERMDSSGHQEVHFPLLIPKTEFQKEAEHIKGFDAEVYWVTHEGLNEMDVPMLLRPTSETAMYPMFRLWVRSHSDLPLKTYQLVNTFRYETKMTRAFIRVREIHFFEAHTCHADRDDAERQIAEDYAIMEDLSKVLCLPCLRLRRPDWDKFAGAVYTTGLDCLMPSGKTLQLGSIHQYEENFSKPFGIEYEDADGKHHHVHQTTYGMSERLLGAIIGIHGDDRGLVLPPGLAPFQAVIIPILLGKKRDEVLAHCREALAELEAAGIRAHIDERELRPGNKFYHWELRGVPVRVELGPRDMESGTAVLVRRDTLEKATVQRDALVAEISSALEGMEADLYQRAKEALDEGIQEPDSPSDVDERPMILTGWCGEMDCAEAMEKDTGRSFLGFPLEGEEKREKRPCLNCGSPHGREVYLSRQH